MTDLSDFYTMINNTNVSNLLSKTHQQQNNKKIQIIINLIYQCQTSVLSDVISIPLTSNSKNDNQTSYFIPYKKTAIIELDKSDVKDKLLWKLNELSKKSNSSNSYELEFNTMNNNLEMSQIIDSIELINNPNHVIDYTHDNIIQYLQAFTYFDIKDKQEDAINQLLTKLNNENILFFLKYINNLYESKTTNQNFIIGKQHSLTFLLIYSYWLVNFLIVKINGFKPYDINMFKYDIYNFNSIVKYGSSSYLSFLNLESHIHIENNNLVYKQKTTSQTNNFTCSLNMLNEVKLLIRKNYLKYFVENEYFNTGKVKRWKTDENLINDYPHLYQMTLDNDPELCLFAIRESENSNFIFSKNSKNFNKFSEDYLGEVEANFWGTQFDIYDNGYDSQIVNKIGSSVLNERKLLGKIIYETNIMGECPRYFKCELFTGNHSASSTTKIEKHQLKNLEPEWNNKMNCYCLNFYGRVKKASARNFQMIYHDDADNIILQHGKESSNDFNIDFREPFNYITAFAHSLVSIGRKRVVS